MTSPKYEGLPARRRIICLALVLTALSALALWGVLAALCYEPSDPFRLMGPGVRDAVEGLKHPVPDSPRR